MDLRSINGKIAMKKSFKVACGMAAMILVSCGGAQQPELERTQWKLVELGGERNPLFEEEDVFTLTFDPGEMSVSGRAVCNRYFGEYTLSGDRLDIVSRGMTRMACPDMELEPRFIGVLDAAERYEIRDGELRLYVGDDRSAVFRPMETGIDPDGQR